MSLNLEKSESKFLERVRTALTNAASHEEIKPPLPTLVWMMQK
ncbi:MAG: hypothetical protein PF517_16190 [Salinivirgaceae bacterium]|jgi:hypothetical protein|nr:hypothetical protein [Salinivirgaceae bacterium]